MACRTFNPFCLNCRPFVKGFDGEPLPDEHPVMVKVHAIWDATPREVQETFHRAVVLASPLPGDWNTLALLRLQIRACTGPSS